MILDNTIIKPTIINYKLIEDSLRYKEVRHFKKTNATGFFPLSDYIHIAKNRGFNKSEAKYLARIKKNGRWDKKILTGLFNTQYKNVFFGDIDKRKHFIVFVFPNKDKEVIIYIFSNYYPSNNDERDKIITKIRNLSL